MSETTTARTKRAPDEFRQAATARGITRWLNHECSLCGYPCAYVFDGDTVSYDAGCDCVRYPSPLRPSSWGDVAAHYNLQSHPDTIAEMDAFWGFA